MGSRSFPAPDWSNQATEEEGRRNEALASVDAEADEDGGWPEALWGILAESGATRDSLPSRASDRMTVLQRYGRIAEGSLTAAFILTQHDAAVRRLAAAAGRGRAEEWLGEIDAGRVFPTVGISQLTTSRRHGPAPVVATEVAGGFRINGMVPWVTAATRADLLVVGAVLEDGRQLLGAVPTHQEGLRVQPPFPLAALQASCTSEVVCDGVLLEARDVLAGPAHDVMATPGLTGTGGLETSALALGQARAAIVALAGERESRSDLSEPIEALGENWLQVVADLLAAAEGRDDAPPAARIRGEADSLVLRATQAYLTARKGSGFLRTEPAQRWARQALFFLVWSCPSPVASAALRDLAGLCAT